MQVFSLLQEKEKGSKVTRVVSQKNDFSVSIFIKKNPSGKETSQIKFGSSVQEVLRANNPVCIETGSGKKPVVTFTFYQSSVIINTFSKETLFASPFYQEFLERSAILDGDYTEEQLVTKFFDFVSNMNRNFVHTLLNNNGTVNNVVAKSILKMFDIDTDNITEPLVVEATVNIDNMMNPFNGENLKEDGVNTVILGETIYYTGVDNTEQVIIDSSEHQVQEQQETNQEPDWDSIAKQEIDRQLESDVDPF